jgi:hypothetical protein
MRTFLVGCADFHQSYPVHILALENLLDTCTSLWEDSWSSYLSFLWISHMVKVRILIVEHLLLNTNLRWASRFPTPT